MYCWFCDSFWFFFFSQTYGVIAHRLLHFMTTCLALCEYLVLILINSEKKSLCAISRETQAQYVSSLEGINQGQKLALLEFYPQFCMLPESIIQGNPPGNISTWAGIKWVFEPLTYFMLVHWFLFLFFGYNQTLRCFFSNISAILDHQITHIKPTWPFAGRIL